MTDELREMLIDQLRDAHSAERQAIQGMKRALRKATAPELKQGIEAHIAQSEEQRERVEQALERLNARAGRKLSNYGVVMENGTVRLSGTGREVLEHPEIGALYLGGAVSSG